MSREHKRTVKICLRSKISLDISCCKSLIYHTKLVQFVLASLTGSSALWRSCTGWRTWWAGWRWSSPRSDSWYTRCSSSRELALQPGTHTHTPGWVSEYDVITASFYYILLDQSWEVVGVGRSLTWKCGLETHLEICLKSGSWILTNCVGSMTSRISSSSPRNITCAAIQEANCHETHRQRRRTAPTQRNKPHLFLTAGFWPELQ